MATPAPITAQPRETVTDRAHGIDVSHYQDTFDPRLTWGQLDFAIAKIGEGYNTPYSTKVDGKFDEFNKLWDGVAQMDIRGVYFYQRSGYSWEKQADLVLEAIEKLAVKPHFINCDVERINNVVNNSMLADSKRILDYWKKNAAGMTAVFYSNKDMMENYLPAARKEYGEVWFNELMAYPFWYAQYWWAFSPNKQPGMPKFKSNWDIWQYSESGDTKQRIDGVWMRHYGSPDLNVYNGTVQEMRTWLKIGQPVPELPPVVIPVPETDTTVKVTVEAPENVMIHFERK